MVQITLATGVKEHICLRSNDMSGELVGHRVSKVECGRSGGSPGG